MRKSIHRYLFLGLKLWKTVLSRLTQQQSSQPHHFLLYKIHYFLQVLLKDHIPALTIS